MFSKQYRVIILQYDCRETLISTLAWLGNLASSNPLPISVRFIFDTFQLIFKSHVQQPRMGSILLRLHLFSLSVNFARFRTTLHPPGRCRHFILLEDEIDYDDHLLSTYHMPGIGLRNFYYLIYMTTL